MKNGDIDETKFQLKAKEIQRDFMQREFPGYYFKFNQGPKMNELWDALQEQAGSFLTDSGFRHVIIVYNYGLTECDIACGNATAKTISYHYQLLNCEKVEIIFFL